MSRRRAWLEQNPCLSLPNTQDSRCVCACAYAVHGKAHISERSLSELQLRAAASGSAVQNTYRADSKTGGWGSHGGGVSLSHMCSRTHTHHRLFFTPREKSSTVILPCGPVQESGAASPLQRCNTGLTLLRPTSGKTCRRGVYILGFCWFFSLIVGYLSGTAIHTFQWPQLVLCLLPPTMMIKETSLRRDPDLRGELAFLARGCDFVLPSRFKKRLKSFQQQQVSGGQPRGLYFFI